MTRAAAWVDMCRPSATSAMEPQSIPPMISAVIIVTQSATTAQLLRSFRSWCAPRNTCSCRHWSIEWACMAPSYPQKKLMMPAAVGQACHHQTGVLLLGHPGQLFKKRYGRPQLLVAVIAPGRHAGHLNAMLDDPEQLGRRVEGRGFGKIRRRRIKAAPDIALGHAGRAVADGAMCRIMLDADKDLGGIIKPGRDRNAGGMRLDRVHARRLDDCAGDGPMRRRCGNVIHAGIDNRRGPEHNQKRGNEQRNNNGWHRRRSQNQTLTPNAKRKSPVVSPACRAKIAVCPNFP